MTRDWQSNTEFQAGISAQLDAFKDDAREVRAGMECGLKIAGYDDVKEGDVLEFYQRIEVARKL